MECGSWTVDAQTICPEQGKDLDESQKSEVRLRDNKPMKVEGKGTIFIKTTQGNVKLLHDVQYVPNLAHNLLSVGQLIAGGYSILFGQLITGGYSILFDDCCCTVYDKKSAQSIVKISMTQNHMFPLEVSSVQNCALIAKTSDTNLWHLRYGHLNVKGLKLLGQKNMVVGLPKI